MTRPREPLANRRDSAAVHAHGNCISTCRLAARGGGRSRGALAVEMAFIFPLVVMLLLGIVEMGMLFHRYIALFHAANAASRLAAVGVSTSEVTEAARTQSAIEDPEKIAVTLTYRTLAGGYWSDWQTLADNTDGNTAPPHAQVRVELAYHHRLLLAGLFSGLADDPVHGTILLPSVSVRMRE